MGVSASGLGGCLSLVLGGVSGPRGTGGCVSQLALGQTPPGNRMTDRQV